MGNRTMRINVAEGIVKGTYYMFVTDADGEELGEFEISEEYYNASIKEFSEVDNG